MFFIGFVCKLFLKIQRFATFSLKIHYFVQLSREKPLVCHDRGEDNKLSIWYILFAERNNSGSAFLHHRLEKRACSGLPEIPINFRSFNLAPSSSVYLNFAHLQSKIHLYEIKSFFPSPELLKKFSSGNCFEKWVLLLPSRSIGSHIYWHTGNNSSKNAFLSWGNKEFQSSTSNGLAIVTENRSFR